MNDMSMRITLSRAARCSSRQRPNQLGRPQVSGPGSGVVPGAPYQPGLSQPLTSRKYAPAAASRSWNGDLRTPRAVASAM